MVSLSSLILRIRISRDEWWPLKVSFQRHSFGLSLRTQWNHGSCLPLNLFSPSTFLPSAELSYFLSKTSFALFSSSPQATSQMQTCHTQEGGKSLKGLVHKKLLELEFFTLLSQRKALWAGIQACPLLSECCLLIQRT